MEEKIKECISVDDKPEDAMEAMRKFTGDDSLQPIDIDDSFGFKCQQCGRCCMNRKDIILNPFDIYNGARYLGITPEEFLKNYTYVDLGCTSKVPMVLLNTNSNGFCPLLKFDIKDGGKFKCMIHAAKPGACSNHPIGVAYSTNKTTGESSTQYVKVQQCENSVSDEMHTVREWVQPYLDHQDEINVAHKIQHLVVDYFNPRDFWMVCATLRKIVDIPGAEDDNKFTEMAKELMERYIIASVSLGYARYDINRPFIEQAEENIKDLDDFYTRTKELYLMIKSCISNISKTLIKEMIANGDLPDFLEEMFKEEQEETNDGDN